MSGRRHAFPAAKAVRVLRRLERAEAAGELVERDVELGRVEVLAAVAEYVELGPQLARVAPFVPRLEVSLCG